MSILNIIYNVSYYIGTGVIDKVNFQIECSAIGLIESFVISFEKLYFQ